MTSVTSAMEEAEVTIDESQFNPMAYVMGLIILIQPPTRRLCMRFNPQTTGDVLQWVKWLREESSSHNLIDQEILWQQLCHNAFMKLHRGDLYTLAQEIAGEVNGNPEAHNSRVLLFYALCHLLHSPDGALYRPRVVLDSMGLEIPNLWTLRKTMLDIVYFCGQQPGNESFISDVTKKAPIWNAEFEQTCREHSTPAEIKEIAQKLRFGLTVYLRMSGIRLATLLATGQDENQKQVSAVWWHRLMIALERTVDNEAPSEFDATVFASTSEGVFDTATDVIKAVYVIQLLFKD